MSNRIIIDAIRAVLPLFSAFEGIPLLRRYIQTQARP
jgi:hypothetical protein